MIGAYINKDKNDGEGRPDEMEGNSVGPFVVPKNESGVVQSAGTVADPMHTKHVDSNGRVEGEVGYVGPVVQTPILKIVTDDILYADLTTDSYTFNPAVDAVWIVNDGSANITVTISTHAYVIKPGESRVIEKAAFTVVAFSANATFRMNGLIRS